MKEIKQQASKLKKLRLIKLEDNSLKSESTNEIWKKERSTKLFDAKGLTIKNKYPIFNEFDEYEDRLEATIDANSTRISFFINFSPLKESVFALCKVKHSEEYLKSGVQKYKPYAIDNEKVKVVLFPASKDEYAFEYKDNAIRCDLYECKVSIGLTKDKFSAIFNKLNQQGRTKSLRVGLESLIYRSSEYGYIHLLGYEGWYDESRDLECTMRLISIETKENIDTECWHKNEKDNLEKKGELKGEVKYKNKILMRLELILAVLFFIGLFVLSID